MLELIESWLYCGHWQAEHEYTDIADDVVVVLEPVMVAQQFGGVSQSRTGAEVAVATLELLDKARRHEPETVLVTLPVDECVHLLNLPASHPFARLNNTYVFVDHPRAPSASGASATARLVPVIEAMSGERFDVPFACIRRVPASDAMALAAHGNAGMTWLALIFCLPLCLAGC